MLTRHLDYPFFLSGAEEITAKRNRDGTYSVEMKTIVHDRDSDESGVAVVKMERANVSVEALVDTDGKGTHYTITIPDDEDPSELPQYQTTAEDWEMLGFGEAEARELADETCS